MTARSVLAIDAGQSGMKVRMSTGSDAQDAVLPGIRTHEPLLPQLASAARLALDRFAAPVDVLAAGVSGLTSREADASALLSLIDDTGIDGVLLAHDSTTSFLGAMGDARGAVVASGTGVVTLAVGRERVARVDGWGHLMGDAGSGFWIGREALDAVMRDFDGRGPYTPLRRVAEARWPDLSEAYIELQSSEDRVSIVASFATAVAELAEGGDPVSRGILIRAGRELAHSAETALRRVGDGDELEVCAIGGVFGAPALRAAFESHVRESAIAARFVAPRGQGIDGVVALADLGSQHPLSADVWSAHR
ncbi:N-acetylglucosamine kinase [Microbacterium sp. HJ5]